MPFLFTVVSSMQQRVNAIHFSADFGIFDWMVATNEAASHQTRQPVDFSKPAVM